MQHAIKNAGKNVLCGLLEAQARRLRRNKKFTIVAVAGSVGKTSSKLAIAHVLKEFKKVTVQSGNYNDRLTVPLVLFGQSEPAIFNIFAWLKILISNELRLRRPLSYEIVVLELGTDAPGQIAQFAYLQPELAIVTAIAPEHMEFFKELDAVAKEELEVIAYSQKTLINSATVPKKYLPVSDRVVLYGTQGKYRAAEHQSSGLEPQKLTLQTGQEHYQLVLNVLGEQGRHMALTAFAVAVELGLSATAVAEAVAHIEAVPGRMQILTGQKGSTIIDDTYNASPLAVDAALDVLYATTAPQRIAILGSMNELGATSAEAHRQVGAYCDAARLSLVVTIGKEAEDYLAPVAAKQGIPVKSFLSPYDAGRYVSENMQPGAAVLVKGSQNRIFAEEAVKVLLADRADANKLVRQTAFWLKQKQRQFPQG